MSKISIKQTLLAAGAAALVGIPIIMGYVQNYPKLSGLSSFLGVVMALMTNPKVVLFVSSLMNLFFPETPATPAAPPVSPEKKEGGFALPSRMAVLLIASAAVLFVMLLPKLVHAQESGEQRYGGCLAPASYGQICVGPRAGALIARYDLTGPMNGKFTGGFQPGAGYEIIFQSTDHTQDWKKIELGVFGSFTIGGSADTIPNSFALTGLVTVFNYISFGVGSQWIQQESGPARASIYITGGATFNIGGSTPAQVKARRAAILKAAEAPQAEGAK